MANTIDDIIFQKNVLWLNGLLPIILLSIDYISGNLGSNPPEAIIRTTGVISILFLILTLSITVFANLTKQAWIIRHRRWLGLFSFYYACLHFLSYIIFDKQSLWMEIYKDIFKRPFILLGFLSLVLMIPLAATSTNKMIAKLGVKNWKRLHKMTYLISFLATIHFWKIVKSDIFYPAVTATIFIVLMTLRFNIYKKSKRQ